MYTFMSIEIYIFLCTSISLFKMFSCWIFGKFKMRSERGYKFVRLMGDINVKDLLDVYQCSCGSFCVSLLTDRRLKDCSKTDFVYIFPTKGVFTSVRGAWYQTVHTEIRSQHFMLRLQISMFWAFNFSFAKNHRENILERTKYTVVNYSAHPFTSGHILCSIL